MTQRAIDQMVEQRVAQRLDRYYTDHGIKFERVNDARQFKGIDIILFTPKGNINIDEKAKYRGLQTEDAKFNSYSFEVSRICRDGIRRNGWFMDYKSETDYYCYSFPKFEQPEDFTSAIKPDMEVVMINKKSIVDIIEQETSLGMIEQFAQRMADEDIKMDEFNNFVLYKTPSYKLPEEPINILMKPEIIASTKNFRRFYV